MMGGAVHLVDGGSPWGGGGRGVVRGVAPPYDRLVVGFDRQGWDEDHCLHTGWLCGVGAARV